MFTGLVHESAPVLRFERAGDALWRLELESSLAEVGGLGASIAVNGACLTLVSSEALTGGRRKLAFEISPETMDRCNFASLKAGGRVHLEPSLRVGDFLGGHWVSGHVDGQGSVEMVERHPDWLRLQIRLDGPARERIAPYLVEKGSITVAGVSLTVNSVRDADGSTFFNLMLIPHTLQVTMLGDLRVGDWVNLEADLMAKYAARVAGFGREGSPT
jgi:riboflavin synthase